MEQEDREDSFELDDLFQDAMLVQAARNPKRAKSIEPSTRNALDAATKKMRELYTLPENWERKRGIALIDKDTQTLVGNFSEYVHKSLAGVRRLVREHVLISIDAQEVVEGYLGESVEMRLRGTWEQTCFGTADLWFDEMLVGAPACQVEVKTRLGVMIRVDLVNDTQLATQNGNVLLKLPAGTNVLEQLSTDSKATVRKAVGL